MKTVSSIFFLLAISGSPLTAQNWLWAKSFGGINDNQGPGSPDNGYAVTIGADSNIYCVGSFHSGNFSVGTFSISGSGSGNSFLAKYDLEGNLINIIAGTGYTNNDALGLGTGIVYKDSDNIYLMAATTGTCFLDTFIITGGSQSYIAKFNSDLRCTSIKTCGGGVIGPQTFYNNNFYSIGLFYTPTYTIDTFTLYNPYGYQSYFAKYDTAGHCPWVKQTRAGNTNYFFNITRAGNYFYLSGQTDSCLRYDTMQICAAGPGTSFIFKTDTNGFVKWSTDFPGNTTVATLSTDDSSNIYTTVAFDSSIIYQGNSLTKVPGSSYGVFMARYSKTDSLVWLKQWYASGRVVVECAYTDSGGYSYYAGVFSGKLALGSDTITAQTYQDLFIARFNPQGECMGTVTIPGIIGINGITEDSLGNAIVTGGFSGTKVLGGTTITANGGQDVFIAKLSAINGLNNSLLPKMLDDRLEIYANPNAGNFTVVVPQSIIKSTSAQLSIYDNTGAEIKNETVDISGNKIQVELGTVQKGLYNVTLSSKGKQFVGKVVIQ